MQITYECREPRLRVNFRHSIIAKDEDGQIVGTYFGYWIPGLCSVSLYPDRSHPAWKPGFPSKKDKVYDGYIKCKVQNAKCGINTSSTASGPPSPTGEGKGETWRDRKLPMAGQETIKF